MSLMRQIGEDLEQDFSNLKNAFSFKGGKKSPQTEPLLPPCQLINPNYNNYNATYIYTDRKLGLSSCTASQCNSFKAEHKLPNINQITFKLNILIK